MDCVFSKSQQFLESYPACFGDNLFDRLYRSVVGLQGAARFGPVDNAACGVIAAKNLKSFYYAAFPVYFGKQKILTLVTAGHIVRELKGFCDDSAISIERLRVLDRGLSQEGDTGVPIRPDKLWAFCTYTSEENPDYGALMVPAFESRQILASDQIEPVSLDMIADPDEIFDAYFLLGFPISSYKQEVLVDTKAKYAIRHHMGCPMLPVTMLNKGKYFNSANGRFVAKIDVGDDLGVSNIKGMSGGPVWGVRHDKAREEFVIKLVAIQSKWIESARVIYAEYALPFLQVVEARIDQIFDESSCASGAI